MARNSKPTKKKGLDRRSRARTGAAAGAGRPRRGRPKVCIFCREHATWVDYKDVGLLQRFTNDRGRIKARGATGTCAQHQRDVAIAVKTARELALLPYAVRTAGTEFRNGRGGDRRGNAGPARTGEASASETSESSVPEAVDQAADADGVASGEESYPSVAVTV